MYQRLNKSSPSLSGPNKSMPTQAPTFPDGSASGKSTTAHNRSSSVNLGLPPDTTEEVDTSTRPRLTQEQVTQLEEEFSKLPKPNTDFKKNLADQIGLTLARVNVGTLCILTIPAY